MTEHEKMLAGKIYDPFTEGMPEERSKAHQLCKLYNDTVETDVERRNEILDALLPNRGRDVYLQGPIYFDFGVNTEIGDNSFANFNFTVQDDAEVTIGDHCNFGPNVTIVTPVHPMLPGERKALMAPDGTPRHVCYARPVHIGNDCWLGANVVVCPGVTIGDGCVIGAGSVVVKDIPANSFAAGNPCRVIRTLSEKDSMENKADILNGYSVIRE